MKYKFLITPLLLLILSNQIFSQYIYPKREVRGVWIATVADIDWPSGQK